MQAAVDVPFQPPFLGMSRVVEDPPLPFPPCLCLRPNQCSIQIEETLTPLCVCVCVCVCVCDRTKWLSGLYNIISNTGLPYQLTLAV